MGKWNEYRRRLKWCEPKNVARLAKYLKIEFPECSDDISNSWEFWCNGTCKVCNAILIERLIRHAQLNLPDIGRTFEK